MNEEKPDFPRLDKTAFSVVSSFEEADEQDREYWWSRTPQERLEYLEFLRWINYGDQVSGRLQRVLEVVERP